MQHFLKIFALFIFLPFQFLSQTWSGTKSAVPTDYVTGTFTATDPFGNVFITGGYDSTITFGSQVLYCAASSYNVFLVKYNAAGNVVWAKSSATSGYAEGWGICCDQSGNVFVTGYYVDDTLRFDTCTASYSNGEKNVFVVKYDSVGNAKWAQDARGFDINTPFSIACDLNGNVLVAGSFDAYSFLFDTTYVYNGSSAQISDGFLAKYDNAGTLLWVKTMKGLGQDDCLGVTTDVAGNIYTCGSFTSDTLFFGTAYVLNSNPGAGKQETYIARYNSSGNISWLRVTSGTGAVVCLALASGTGGSLFLTGTYFSGDVIFGSDTLINNGGNDYFLANYDTSGNFFWVKNAFGTGDEMGYSLAADNSGNVYVAGVYGVSQINFGPYSLAPPGGNGYPFFIVKYDGAGNELCAHSLADGAYFKNTLAIDPSGVVYAAGCFFSDSLVVGVDTLQRYGMSNAFLTRYDCNIPLGLTKDSHGTFEPHIFPNPSNGKFKVKLNSLPSEKNNLEIFDPFGKRIFIAENVTDKTEIDICGVTPGIYFARISSGAIQFVRRIVVR